MLVDMVMLVYIMIVVVLIGAMNVGMVVVDIMLVGLGSGSTGRGHDNGCIDTDRSHTRSGIGNSGNSAGGNYNNTSVDGYDGGRGNVILVVVLVGSNDNCCSGGSGGCAWGVVVETLECQW